jgi:hypothetical protein
MRKLLASLLLFFSISAEADYINIGGVSHHFNPERKYNETNYGLGYEYKYNDKINLMVGWYRNSVYNDSYYATARYTPDRDSLIGGRVFGGDINYMIGGISGYKKYVVPAVLPAVCWEYACVFIIPKIADLNRVTVVGLNFRIKI